MRKSDHIRLAKYSQNNFIDHRFFYEPLLSRHPSKNMDMSIKFLGKNLKYPLWISSMTGDKKINFNLARAAKYFKIGISLGSVRSILENSGDIKNFDIRPILGKDIPFFANLGIAQIEKLVYKNNLNIINKLILKIKADGLVVHVNPLQEWLQKEGDIFKIPPLDTLKELLKKLDYPLIVKEVGQGMGPESIKAVLNLDIAAFELAALGGTNFSILEGLRNGQKGPLESIGHTAMEMIGFINSCKKKCKNFIISGGVDNILDAYYLQKKLKGFSIIGNAFKYLKVANNFSKLKEVINKDMDLLALANCYLRIR